MNTKDSTKEDTCLAFALFRDKYKFAIKLNPTDRRGYRILVTYVNAKVNTTDLNPQ